MSIEELTVEQEIVNKTNLKHIAVIMDGNRRWAKERLLPSAAGHKKGVDALRDTLKACIDFGVKYLTVYAFSTENWKRTEEEVGFLLELLAKTIIDEIPEFNKNGVKVKFIGDRVSLKKEIVDVIQKGEKETAHNQKLTLQIAFNYGARQEITNAVKIIATKVQNGELLLDEICENTFNEFLYTKDIPDPDLLIRTGGEKRISNYLLWQCAYSEIYVTDTYWPEFGKKALSDAIIEFNNRNRRFGK